MVEIPLKIHVQNLARAAHHAARPLALLSGKKRTDALLTIAEHLKDATQEILDANRRDLDAVPTEGDKSLYRQTLDRIRFTAGTLDEMTEHIRSVALLPDPVGEVSRVWNTEEGMQVRRVRVPLGVIGVISEFAATVMTESVALCLKSGNVCFYRGGREWQETNVATAKIIQEALESEKFPPGTFTFLDRSEPEGALEICRHPKLVNAIIPRGKGGLRKAVLEQSRVPVLGFDGGPCQIFIDEDADLPLAQTVVVNSKVQDPTASNSLDTLLVHQTISRRLLPGLLRRLLEEWKVDLLGCPTTISIMGIMEMTGHKGIGETSDETWSKKFQSPTLAIKVVNSLDEAIAHTARYGPGHTASIITRDYMNAMKFVQEVDACAVFVNASTRLHHGPRLGLGPELGMNVSPFHTRGPITLESLTAEKIVGLGSGQLSHPHPVPHAYEDAMMMSPKF